MPFYFCPISAFHPEEQRSVIPTNSFAPFHVSACQGILAATSLSALSDRKQGLSFVPPKDSTRNVRNQFIAHRIIAFFLYHTCSKFTYYVAQIYSTFCYSVMHLAKNSVVMGSICPGVVLREVIFFQWSLSRFPDVWVLLLNQNISLFLTFVFKFKLLS